MLEVTPASAPSLGDLSNFFFFTAIRDFLLADDGLITQWTAGMAQRLSLLLGMIVLPLVTLWILFHGYRIVTGRSREPLMALVADSARTSLIVFIATGASMGNPWIAGQLNDLDQLISTVVTGSTGMGAQIQESLGWMQFALTSIDVLPTGGDAAVATAKDRTLWFTGIGTAGPAIIGGTLLMLFQIVMRFLVAVGPLAILCLLFKATMPIFQRWLQYCVGTLFRLAVAAVMTTIALKMVCAVAAAFWVDRLINAAVQNLPGVGVDLHMAEGIISMALQQGGLGLIMTLLIVTVPKMTADFFMGALGDFSHYSVFGGTGGINSTPGPQGQPPSSYRSPTETQQQRPEVPRGRGYQPNVIGASAGQTINASHANQDTVKTVTRT